MQESREEHDEEMCGLHQDGPGYIFPVSTGASWISAKKKLSFHVQFRLPGTIWSWKAWDDSSLSAVARTHFQEPSFKSSAEHQPRCVKMYLFSRLRFANRYLALFFFVIKTWTSRIKCYKWGNPGSFYELRKTISSLVIWERQWGEKNTIVCVGFQVLCTHFSSQHIKKQKLTTINELQAPAKLIN